MHPSETANAPYNSPEGSDGAVGNSPLVFDSAGNLYGEASNGGDLAGYCKLSTPAGCGVVFELTPAGEGPWTENVLHPFTGGADGWGPQSNLLFDSAGNLYGVTEFGGINGFGVVFELQPPQNAPFKTR